MSAFDHGHQTPPMLDLEKITFELPPSDWHSHASESVWAKKVRPDTYQVRNVPFYVRGIAYGDIVRTRPGEPFPIVDSVSEPSGHSTYRVISSAEAFAQRWPTLSAYGCTYERANENLVAIDVPANADIKRVYSALEDGVNQGQWDFEEGHCGHRV